jgi:hypothetical protein
MLGLQAYNTMVSPVADLIDQKKAGTQCIPVFKAHSCTSPPLTTTRRILPDHLIDGKTRDSKRLSDL